MDQPPQTTVTTTATVEWSNLPRDILEYLLKFIDLTLDLPRIRGVCSPWRNNLPLNQLRKPPSQFAVPNLKEQNGPSTLLIQSRVYLISPLSDNTTPLLVRIVETGVNKWSLVNPLSAEKYYDIDTPILPVINLLDSHVLELAKPWSVDPWPSDTTLLKMVVSNLNASYIPAVLVQLSSRKGDLIMFKRSHDPQWVQIKGTFPDHCQDSEYQILDIAYHNGLFYAFELVNWKVGVIDPSKTEISSKFMDAPNCLGERIENKQSVSIDGGNYIVCGVYLVPCNAQLYLVIRSSKVGSEKNMLFVFMLKEGDKIEEHNWERVTSLGNQIFFIWYDVSFGVSSTSLPNFQPGTICLYQPLPSLYDVCGSLRCWRHLNMYNVEEEEKGFVEVQELSMKDFAYFISSPPTWVKWRCLA